MIVMTDPTDRIDLDPADEEIFAAIEATYASAAEPEQRAMLKELRHGLPAIPAARRTVLIDAIERSIRENLEWEDPEY
jgi:hypothetical protein